MPPPSQRKPRIYVAEDNQAILDLILTRLAIAGYETRFGRDGAAALEGIRSQRPDAVLLDLNMPRLDGFDVLRLMKNHESTRRTPVMVLSARNAPDDIREALALGASDYLTKPFPDSQLLSRVARLLRSRPVTPSLLPPRRLADRADIPPTGADTPQIRRGDPDDVFML